MEVEKKNITIMRKKCSEKEGRKENIKVCGQDPSEAQTAKDIQRPQLTWFDVSDSVFLLDTLHSVSLLSR